MDYSPPSGHVGKEEECNLKDATGEGKINEVKTEGTLNPSERNQAVVTVPHIDSSNSKVMDQNVSKETGQNTGVTYMDVPISADDVMRAGGLGARDDISSFLPVAIDSTDFEASLRDARDFEEPQGEISRPGLGWCEPAHDQ